jgi:hypothetical protein
MIYIYGDSHAGESFRGLQLPHTDLHQNSVTMHRIGRDGIIINFDPEQHTNDSIVCFMYGEVDCRCHVQRQIDLGRDENEVISELVRAYFGTLKKNIRLCKAVVVVGVVPPTIREKHEDIHGPITHAFPFVGTDMDRVRYTKKVNRSIQAYCKSHGYTYFAPYAYYTSEDGTMKRELSDLNVHLGDTSVFVEEFTKCVNSLK